MTDFELNLHSDYPQAAAEQEAAFFGGIGHGDFTPDPSRTVCVPPAEIASAASLTNPMHKFARAQGRDSLPAWMVQLGSN